MKTFLAVTGIYAAYAYITDATNKAGQALEQTVPAADRAPMPAPPPQGNRPPQGYTNPVVEGVVQMMNGDQTARRAFDDLRRNAGSAADPLLEGSLPGGTGGR